MDIQREHAFFSKNKDGYPNRIGDSPVIDEYFGIDKRRVGLLDFYDSFSSIS